MTWASDIPCGSLMSQLELANATIKKHVYHEDDTWNVHDMSRESKRDERVYTAQTGVSGKTWLSLVAGLGVLSRSPQVCEMWFACNAF